MRITALHTEGILSIELRINGGLKEEDVAKINLKVGQYIDISDRFATSQDLIDAENAGLISTTEYETGDLTAMNKEKTIEVVSRDVTQNVNVVNTPEVKLSDQTTYPINLRMVRVLNNTTLAANTAIDDQTITFVAGHNYVVGNTVCLKEDTRYYQGEVIAVNGNIITLDTPLDYAFTTAATCGRTDENMNVNGSVTPVIFHVSPKGLDDGVQWDITRVAFYLEGDDAMDGGLFGDLAALTKGIVFRYKDGEYKNILNAKTNGELSDFCQEENYDDRASNKGVYSFRCVKVFGGQQNQGVVIRLSATTEDELQIIVQDNLSGLAHFHVSVVGHLVD